jgi:hypothetical protein
VKLESTQKLVKEKIEEVKRPVVQIKLQETSSCLNLQATPSLHNLRQLLQQGDTEKLVKLIKSQRPCQSSSTQPRVTRSTTNVCLSKLNTLPSIKLVRIDEEHPELSASRQSSVDSGLGKSPLLGEEEQEEGSVKMKARREEKEKQKVNLPPKNPHQKHPLVKNPPAKPKVSQSQHHLNSSLALKTNLRILRPRTCFSKMAINSEQPPPSPRQINFKFPKRLAKNQTQPLLPNQMLRSTISLLNVSKASKF